MSNITLTNTQAIITDALLNELINKVLKNNNYEKISENKLLPYLCSLVLEHTRDSLKDRQITSEERVDLITNIMYVLVKRLPLKDSLKDVLINFITDDEIQNLIEDLDKTAGTKCMRFFGKIFRACVRSNSN
jgi:uncharacterized membrane protein YheB (UPF0754 family)